MSAMRIAVLGGTGFVGHRLCARLVEAGHEVRVLTRHRERHRDLLVLPNAQLVEADVHNPVVLRRELQGLDAVVNLVGILNETRRQSFARVHAELPDKLVQACRQARVPRLLHMSALPAAVDAPSRYLQSKGQGERTVLGAQGADLHVTVFRPSVIFGPHDSFINRFAALLKLAPVLPLACPQARLQPVYVEDVVQAFVTTLDRHDSFGQRYNLCGPRAYTLAEIVAYVATVLGLRRRIVPLGDRLSRLQATLLQFAPGRPFTPDNYRSLSVPSTCADPYPAALGMAPKPLEAIVPSYLGRGF
jgi:NADH dehydrogenase